MIAPMPIRTPLTDPGTLELSQPWVRWLASVVAQVPLSGTGSPEGVVIAGVGSLYLRTDGGPVTSLYVKESGTEATGWVAK